MSKIYVATAAVASASALVLWSPWLQLRAEVASASDFVSLSSLVHRPKGSPGPGTDRWQTAKASTVKKCTRQVVESGIPGLVIGVTVNGKMAYSGGQYRAGLVIHQSLRIERNLPRQTLVVALQPVYSQLTDTPQSVGFSI